MFKLNGLISAATAVKLGGWNAQRLHTPVLRGMRSPAPLISGPQAVLRHAARVARS